MAAERFNGEPLDGGELAALVACLDCGSMHGAAERLDLTQSAVTKRIGKLEARLGLQLLERSRTGVSATAAGEAVADAARRALEALGGVLVAADVHRQVVGGELRIAASRTIGDYLAPGWVAAFTAQHPGVATSLDITNSPAVLAAVSGGHVDVGFIENRDPAHGMARLIAGRDEITVVVSTAHRFAHRTTLAPRELVGEAYIAREPGSGTRSVAEDALAQAGVHLIPTLEAPSTQALLGAVRESGFALLSRLVSADAVAAGALVAIPLRGLDLRRDLIAVHRGAAELTGAAKAFWDWLAGRAKLAAHRDSSEDSRRS